MHGHPRLYRRGAVYWHRAAVPVDIADSYPKTEETFSLRTKDHREALKLVRIEAARVDRLFDEHRRRMALQRRSLRAARAFWSIHSERREFSSLSSSTFHPL